MKIEDQVCTREQSEMLQSLGIAATSYFSWYREARSEWRGKEQICWDGLGPTLEITPNAAAHGHQDRIFPAFNVAELGLMLPADCASFREDHFETIWIAGSDDGRHGREGKTEAEARCTLLIYMLEMRIITAEEVNERLANA